MRAAVRPSTPTSYGSPVVPENISPENQDVAGGAGRGKREPQHPPARHGVPAAVVGGYTTFAARIGYKLSDCFTFSLSGTNLNRSVIEESPYPAVERQVFATLTGTF